MGLPRRVMLEFSDEACDLLTDLTTGPMVYMVAHQLLDNSVVLLTTLVRKKQRVGEYLKTSVYGWGYGWWVTNGKNSLAEIQNVVIPMWNTVMWKEALLALVAPPFK